MSNVLRWVGKGARWLFKSGRRLGADLTDVTEGRSDAPAFGPLFDEQWYLSRGAGAEAADSPLDHYLNHGGFLKYDPNRFFDTTWYFERHPALRAEGGNPLLHYVQIGEAAGDAPGPYFDPSWYLSEYPDVKAAKISPLAHYLEYGLKEGRLPKSPRHFLSTSELVVFLSDLPSAMEAQDCSIDMPLCSLRQIAIQGDGVRPVRPFYEAHDDTCEGVDGPLDFPGAVSVMHVENVLVIAGTRYVLSPAGFIIHDETAHFFNQSDAAIKYQRASRSSSAGSLKLGFGARQGAWIARGVNVMHEYENNYFHFVAESIPKMLLAEEAGVPLDVPFLRTRGLHPNIAALFDRVNVARRPVMLLEPGTAYQVGELFQASDATVVVDTYEGLEGDRRSGLDVTRIRRGVELCQQPFLPRANSGKRKIFASRGGSIRRLLNQKTIEERLAAIGFEIIRADELSLEDQVRIFQDAEIIVGPTGAQMTNIVWCAPGTSVIVLASDHPGHQLFLWDLLGRVSKVVVKTIQGPRAYTRDDIYSVHDDYTVDINRVLAAARLTEKVEAMS